MMKRIMGIIGVIILVVAAAAAALVGKSFIAAKKPSIKENYYTEFSSYAPLEQ